MAALIDILAAGVIDGNGEPLDSGTVDVYKTGTTTPADVYADAALSTTLSNPFTLSAVGKKEAYVTEPVRLLIKDYEGNTIDDIDRVGSGADSLPASTVLEGQLPPIGSIIPFYDYDGDLTFDTDYWTYCNGGSAIIGGVVRATPDLSNRYLVGFGATVNEVQLLTCNHTPTGGTFTVSYEGQTSAAINWNDTDDQATAKIEAMSTIGTGNASLRFDGSTVYTLRFLGSLGGTDVDEVTCSSSLTYASGAVTLTVSTDTAGSGGGDIATAAWSTDPVGFSAHQVEFVHTHTGPSHSHNVGQAYSQSGSASIAATFFLDTYGSGDSISVGSYTANTAETGTTRKQAFFASSGSWDGGEDFISSESGTGVTGKGLSVPMSIQPRSIRTRFILRRA